MANFDKISINGTYYNVKDTAAQQKITAETKAREAADTALGQKITKETEAREKADTALSNRISSIENAKNIKTVVDYGAKGDGVTDDTSAFVQSLSEQGICIIPKGVFAITSLTVTDAQSIIGESPELSVLKATTSSNVIIGSHTREAVFRNFGIDGNNVCNHGFFFDDCPSGLIESCSANNCLGTGFHLSGITYETQPLWKVQNCFASANGSDGFYIGTPDAIVDGCTAVSNCQSNEYAAGINVVGVSCKISNCHCWTRSSDSGLKSPNYAMRISGQDVVIVNCHIEGGAKSCLLATQAAYNLYVIGCIIYAPLGTELVYISQWYPTFIGCHISNTGGTASANAFFNGSSECFTIIGCRFDGNIPLFPGNGTMNNSYIQGFFSGSWETVFRPVNIGGCRGFVQTQGGIWHNLGS